LHSSGGGGIYNTGALTLTNSEVSQNASDYEGSCSASGGGGIYNYQGTVALANSAVSENNAEGLDGGGIYNNSLTLTLTKSIVSGNTAVLGGGINNVYGGGVLIDSTVTGNSASQGGGIYGGGTLVGSTVSENSALNGGGIINEASLTLINSTLSSNSAYWIGGIEDYGDTLIINSTVAENTATESPAGIWDAGGWPATIANSLINNDCAAAFPEVFSTSNGHNIESPGDTCGFDQATDQVNVTAEQLALGPLQDNGGPTMTHALLPGSVAIDVIAEADCVDADGEPLTTDQRGEPRPETGGTLCDVGAFEVQP
jgi:predicted outer membrane repeat protein